MNRAGNSRLRTWRRLGRSPLGAAFGASRSAIVCLATSVVALSSCYASGSGTEPPASNFYYPVGLAVSRGGNVLYAVNSDFDLQFNGGTIQSYDLHLIRKHAVRAIANPADETLPLIRHASGSCPGNPAITRNDGSGGRQAIGETCSPPVDSTFYERDSAIIGAFATELQLSKSGTRLFFPVRGNASLSWADVVLDDPAVAPPETRGAAYAPFGLDCGERSSGRCASSHLAGADANEAGNTRGLAMPGEPFGMAQSADGAALVVTHQADTKVSLFSTGFSATGAKTSPALQFVLDGVDGGGTSIAPIPLDPEADPCASQPSAAPCPAGPAHPAFLLTSRAAAELTLLRYYPDDGSSLNRPYLTKEATYPITVNASGFDSRHILVDPSPQIACKLQVAAADPTATPPRTDAQVDAERFACAQKPSRVFIVNRSPASLLVGEVGSVGVSGTGASEHVNLYATLPLTVGPSRVYLAPIVDGGGRLALRLFVVCFDSATLFVVNPDTLALEASLRVGQGPFAMAFDPFTLEDAIARKKVDVDTRDPDSALKRYRFAYVANFSLSFVQLVDLDGSRADKSTFERVVFTLGVPTAPKGS